jgi:hypothetical protein
MTEDRGQTITLDYTIGLGISVILVTGLLIAGAGFVDDQRERAARIELEVVGQQVAADVEAADRLAATTGANPTVRVSRELPGDVAGAEYRIELVEQADPHLELTATDPAVSVQVEFANVTAVSGSQVTGGPVAVAYTGSGTLELREGSA